MPFKAVVKPKSSKNISDEIVEDNISSDPNNVQKEDDIKYVNLSEPNGENLKFNQYQQVGQENNLNIIQDGNVAAEQQNLLNASESKVNIDSNSENIYKTLDPNVNIYDGNNLENNLLDDQNSINSIQSQGIEKTNQFTNANSQPPFGNQENNTQSISNSDQNLFEYQDGTTLSSPGLTTGSNTLGENESNVIQSPGGMQSTDEKNLSQQSDNKTTAAQENQVIYKTLQPGQDLNDNNTNYGSEKSIFDTPPDQIKGDVTKAEPTPIRTDIKGETSVPETTQTGVTGQTEVVPVESFGVTGESKTQQIESFGVTGDKTVLDSSDDGNTAVNFDNNQSNNIYKLVGPEIAYDNENTLLNNQNQNINSNILNNNNFEDEQSDTTPSNNSKLTFDQMSSAGLKTQSFAEGSNRVESDLDSNYNNNEKAIYGSLPQQQNADGVRTKNIDEFIPENNLSDANSINQISDRAPGAAGETSVIQRDFSGAKGVSGVSLSDFSGAKGETGVNLPDVKSVTGTTADNNQKGDQQSYQQLPSISDNAKKIIINKPGANTQAQDLNNISGQNTFAYEDIQTSGSRRQLNKQGEEFIQEPLTQRPNYKTITDNLGNTYQVDEYGNKISDADFSFEELKSENNSQDNSNIRYSTIDGVRAVGVTNETSIQSQDGQDLSDTPQDSASDSLSVYNPNVTDGNNAETFKQNNRATSRNVNQTQSVYTPLSNTLANTSRITKSDNTGSDQKGVKNYNFIQKLSMTINRALGIEPQSVKDEINLTNLDSNQELELDKSSTRIINPRVTGLLESEDTEDEDEERKNRRKKLRYKRVGYVEPNLTVPEPVKLDDETQSFQDLYGERNRFDTTFADTNSALLRRAEEEIEKQSESVKEANIQESQNDQPVSQDTESIYYIELMKERARLEQALDDERESNRLAIRKSEDNIQQQLLDLILNNQSSDINAGPNDPVNQLVQTLIAEDKNKTSEQVVIDATKIVQMIQNQITESNGNPVDEYLLRKRIEEELKSEFIYMQKEQEKKMKLVYKKMLEDMYMDMINN